MLAALFVPASLFEVAQAYLCRPAVRSPWPCGHTAVHTASGCASNACTAAFTLPQVLLPYLHSKLTALFERHRTAPSALPGLADFRARLAQQRANQVRRGKTPSPRDAQKRSCWGQLPGCAGGVSHD